MPSMAVSPSGKGLPPVAAAAWSRVRKTVPIAGSPGNAPGIFRKSTTRASLGVEAREECKDALHRTSAFAGICPGAKGERMQ